MVRPYEQTRLSDVRNDRSPRTPRTLGVRDLRARMGKPIRLVAGGHEISCKIDGGAIGLKACFVKNA